MGWPIFLGRIKYQKKFFFTLFSKFAEGNKFYLKETITRNFNYLFILFVFKFNLSIKQEKVLLLIFYYEIHYKKKVISIKISAIWY